MLRALFLVFAATSCLGAQARSLAAVRSCAGGSKYEVYRANTFTTSLHAIMGYRDNVPSLDACAKLCLAAKGCKCAYYPVVGGACAWRQDACSTSELFINDKPVTRMTGLISICGKAAVPDTTPQRTAGQVATWGTCGGAKYKGSKCCGPQDRCVEQSQWYSQCIPKNKPIPQGWTGKISHC